jgi:hypothetical protein
MSEKKRKYNYRLANCETGQIEANSLKDAARIAKQKARQKKTCVSYVKEVN